LKTYLLIKTTRKGDRDYTFGPFRTIEGAQAAMRDELSYITDKDALEKRVIAGEYYDEENGYEIVERELE
jgi:hypothetical protein